MKRLIVVPLCLLALIALVPLGGGQPATLAQPAPTPASIQYPPGVTSIWGMWAWQIILLSDSTARNAIDTAWSTGRDARDGLNVQLDQALKTAKDNAVACFDRANATSLASGLDGEALKALELRLICACNAAYLDELNATSTWLTTGSGRTLTFASFERAVTAAMDAFETSAEGSYNTAANTGMSQDELGALWQGVSTLWSAQWAYGQQLETTFVTALDKNQIEPLRQSIRDSQAYFNCTQASATTMTVACQP